MPNKLWKPKGIKEIGFTSISKYNAAHGTEYLLFDMRDISGYKGKAGFDGNGRMVYLKEFFSVMFGNHELTEYVFTEKGVFDRSVMQGAKKERVADCVMEYTYKRGPFSRRHYNAYFEYGGVEYYVYVKSCNDVKFSELMTEFFTEKLT